jgi:hypothetical protein
MVDMWKHKGTKKNPTKADGHELCNRVFCKVRKTQHQNLEFGPKPGEIEKKPAKKYISLKGVKLRNAPFYFILFYFCGKLSFILF